MASSSQFDPSLEQMILQHDFEKDLSDQLRRLACNDYALTTLNLYYNQIACAGAAAQAFSSNSILTSLYLSFNEIGATSAAAIAYALTSNSALKTLYLRNDQIGDTGAAIAQTLSSNSTLTTLYLHNNR